MKHNQQDEASKQNEKGTSHQKQTPKNQDSSNSVKTAQHGQSSRDQSNDDQTEKDQTGKHAGAKKHAETGKSK